MKKLIVFAMAFAAVFASDAQSSRRRSSGGSESGKPKGKEAQVIILRKAEIGAASLLYTPFATGGSNLGRVSKRQRQWIVPELEYKTVADWTDDLTITWHLLLDTKTAKFAEKAVKDKEPIPRYSYYTVTVRYVNILKGSHAASCVLAPSVLERYGEPVVIAAVITDKDGEILDGQNMGADKVFGKKLADMWWQNEEVLSARDAKGVPLVARRQGLLDRSKTIFALVNADDYEMVQQ